MSPRQPVPIPFGAGLDRGKGPMIADPGSMAEDLRNVHLVDGLAIVRGGIPDIATVLDEDDITTMTSVLAGEYFKAWGIGILVAWREDTGDVRLYRVQRDGTDPVHIGLWFTLDASAVAPPKVWLAELAGLMFAAHDEQALSRRAPTVYYDPTAAEIHPLVASWAYATDVDPAGDENAIRYTHNAPLDTVVTVTYEDPGMAAQPLAIAIVGGDITVSLATDGGSAITTTAAELVAAFEADLPSADLVSAFISPGDGDLGDGSGILAPIGPITIAADGLRFRGVEAHLGAYLAGWGFGTYLEAHPEYVRMSMPGLPTEFQLQHYMPIGSQGDAVLSCFSTGNTLLCLKASELWDHYGTDRRSFGKRQLDDKIGIASSQLGIVVDADGGGSGLLFWWAAQGPKVTGGGGIVDLEPNLALYAPDPADLMDPSAIDAGFAAYLPQPHRQVRFHFGARYYAWDLTSKRWSYGETAREVCCAFHLPNDDVGVLDPGSIAAAAVTADVETP